MARGFIKLGDLQPDTCLTCHGDGQLHFGPSIHTCGHCKGTGKEIYATKIISENTNFSVDKAECND